MTVILGGAQRLPLPGPFRVESIGGGVEAVWLLFPQGGLRQEGQKVIIAAMPIVEQNLAEAVARDLVQDSAE